MKIGIIGVGSVGGAIASRIVAIEAAREIVLIDKDKARVRAAASDLSHAAAFGTGMKIYAGNYQNLKNADIVIISAGENQKIGQSRTDLAGKNAAVMADIVPKIMAITDKITLIVVSNPLDSMVMVARKISNLPDARVIGTGTMLDSARLRGELSHYLGVSPQSIDAHVLGEHGDSSVINWDLISIDGVSLADFTTQTKISLTAKIKSEIERNVRGAAMEIITGRGATWDGIAAATGDLVKCIANDERRVLPVSIFRNKTAYSLPCIVGRNGVIASFPQRGLSASIRAIQKTYKTTLCRAA
jgi:L-lactate dehydrogenase